MTLLLTLLLAASTCLDAQRHLPKINIFRSPGLLLLDSQSEDPAVYDGSGPVRSLRKGESFDIQVFAPRIVGQRVFECGFSADIPADRSVPLEITSARDWNGNELMSGKPNRTLIFNGTLYAITPVPRTGHVMTLTFTATEDTGGPPPLQVLLSVTVVSDPPRRVNQIVGRSWLYWG